MKKPPTKSGSVRLTVEHWKMLRELMQQFGRAWLEKAIEREHRKASHEQAI
jgi:hypothetical protein